MISYDLLGLLLRFRTTPYYLGRCLLHITTYYDPFRPAATVYDIVGLLTISYSFVLSPTTPMTTYDTLRSHWTFYGKLRAAATAYNLYNNLRLLPAPHDIIGPPLISNYLSRPLTTSDDAYYILRPIAIPSHLTIS